MADIVPLTVEHLREIRDAIQQTNGRLDGLTIEVAEVRGELRGTRVALHGLSYMVNLSSGDIRAELGQIRERLDRLELERA